MKLFCGSDISEPTTDTLYQFEEGKRAHTIKFSPYPMEKNANINTFNNNRIIKFPNTNKSIKNQNINDKLLLNNNKKTTKESNKFSNEISELEIIEYPIEEIQKNDYIINNIIKQRGKDNNNSGGCQNNIINYLKNKPGFNRLNLLMDEEDSSLDSNSEDKYNIKEDSSKSDEIICSYVEIDNNNSIANRAKKENSVIKTTSKIFSQIHKGNRNNHSFGLNFNNNSCNNKKTKSDTKVNSITKTKSINNKINNLKKIKKIKNDIVINKLVINKKIIQHKNGLNHNEKKEKSKTKFAVNKSSNSKGFIFDNLKAFNSFRTIDYKRNTSPTNKTLITEKSNIIPRKTHKLNTERVKNYIHVNKTITRKNKLNSKEKEDNTRKFQTIKVTSNKSNKNKTKKIISKNNLYQNSKTLFNSIEVKKNTNLKKCNFLTYKKDLLNSKTRKTINANNFDSKGKLRKLLLTKNYMNISKPKFDISLNNINNNMNLIIKREKNKTANKLLNKSEANKEMNNRNKIKSHNKNNNKDNNRNSKGFLIKNSISKIFK